MLAESLGDYQVIHLAVINNRFTRTFSLWLTIQLSRAITQGLRMSGGALRECVTKKISEYVMVLASGDIIGAMMLKYLSNARGNRIGPQISYKHNVGSLLTVWRIFL